MFQDGLLKRMPQKSMCGSSLPGVNQAVAMSDRRSLGGMEFTLQHNKVKLLEYYDEEERGWGGQISWGWEIKEEGSCCFVMCVVLI